MAQNTSPVFLKTPRQSWVQTSTAAVTGTDGTDGNVKTVFTADATNGSKIEAVTVMPSATVATTIIRFWVNNGATAVTATNNTLVYEQQLPSSSLGTTTPSSTFTWYANLALPAGYKLLVAAAVATSAINITAAGGDY